MEWETPAATPGREEGRGILASFCLLKEKEKKGEEGGEGNGWTDFNSSVERGTGKLVVVFWVEDDHHHVVAVAFEHLATLPLLLPVPQLYRHVVWREREGGGLKHVVPIKFL